MDDKLVSIIMPAYNTADFISDSIYSVLNQTYQYFELIIIDDCSSDNTIEMIERFKDKRIVLIKNNCNQGAAFCRNKALTIAKGRWIAFLDSDDIWLPNKLETQINYMITRKYSFTYTKYREINCDGSFTNNVVSGPNKINHIKMLAYCWPGCLTVMYDCTKIGLIQIKNIQKNNDYAMWLKISTNNDCYLLKETLALYRKGRPNSISSSHYIHLIKWHYILFRNCQNYGIFKSCFLTLGNVIFGIFKKIIYKRKEEY